MGKIYYIIGKSSTGKDSILDALVHDPELALKKIVQYTTRPIRGGEEEGREYHFITMEESDELIRKGLVVELREYDTVYGPWRYMMVNDAQLDLDSDNYIAVGTCASYEKVRDYFGKERVVPIYVYVETGERLQRALDRERSHERPKYAEMCRRFLADEEDFADDRLRDAGLMDEQGNVIHAVENVQLDSCIRKIREIILRQMAEENMTMELYGLQDDAGTDSRE